MPNFPFPRFFAPNYYQPYRNNYGYQNTPFTENTMNSTNITSKDITDYNLEKIEKKETRIANSSHSRSFGPVRFNFDNPFDIDKNEPIIDILGISLYLDDLIIIGLLFFLYQEGVKDESLFFTLILLLLT